MNDLHPRRIVMLGGSFNPPTIAHFLLLQSALDGAQADLGLYVPSCGPYVRKKRSMSDHPEEVFSDEDRLAMLRAMCESDSRMAVCEEEMSIQTPSSRSYRTMRDVQRQYPDPQPEVCFIFGADKLSDLPNWRSFPKMTRDFRLVIFHREGFDIEAAFTADERLAQRREAFIFLPQPGGMEAVSSSAIRDALRECRDPAAMMHPGAYRAMGAYEPYVPAEAAE